MQGKTKIEFFDGLTGKKKDEHIEKNLITDALTNLQSLRRDYIIGCSDVSRLYRMLTPIYPNYIRGLFLWDNTISSGASTITKPPGLGVIGHAGSAYSGANPKRGTLNPNETVRLDNGWRMVWDFATDRAVGTIKSLSLTSVWGGNSGFGNTYDTDGTHLYAPSDTETIAASYIANAIISLPAITNTSNAYYAGEFKRGVHTFIYAAANTTTLNIYECQLPSALSFGLGDKAGLSAAQTAEHTTLTLPHSADHHYRWSMDKSGNLIITNITSNRTVNFMEISLSDKTYVGTTTVTFPENMTAGMVKRIGDQYYGVNSSAKLCRYALDGTKLEELGNSCNTMGFLGPFGEYFYHPDSTGLKAFLCGPDEWTMVHTGLTSYNGDYYYPVAHRHSTQPLPLYTDMYRKARLYTAYLATVNNLSTPVVKNDLNTMKVTYEITEE